MVEEETKQTARELEVMRGLVGGSLALSVPQIINESLYLRTSAPLVVIPSSD